MNIAQNPSSCTVEAFYKRKTLTPRQYGIPIFLRQRVLTNPHEWAKYFDRNKHLYGNYESMQVVHEKDVSLAKSCAKVLCARPISKLSRSLATSCNWKLAPNRYNIKGQDLADIIKKKTGTKGPYYKNTLRNDKSLYGHLKVPKPPGVYKFYNIPSSIDLMNRPYNKHKFKFLIGSRNGKPRNPSDPSSAHYFPKNHCLETHIVKPIKAKPITVFNFLPNSSVPSNDMAYLNTFDKSIPGPGRYDPVELACPCQSKKIINPRIWQEIEDEKRKRFRHQKYKRIKEELYCPCSKVRNIRGHGHTSVFKSKTARLVKRVSFSKKLDRLGKMYHTAKYIQMIVNPPRIPISCARIDLTPKPTEFTFNSIVKPKLQCNMNVNRRIAFLSVTPRFKDDEKESSKIERARVRSDILPKSKKIKAITARRLVSKDNVGIRLQKLPPRFGQKQTPLREKVFTFSPLPVPKLLVKKNDIISRKPNAHFYNNRYKIEDFFKVEYRTTLDQSQKSSLSGEEPEPESPNLY